MYWTDPQTGLAHKLSCLFAGRPDERLIGAPRSEIGHTTSCAADVFQRYAYRIGRQNDTDNLLSTSEERSPSRKRRASTMDENTA